MTENPTTPELDPKNKENHSLSRAHIVASTKLEISTRNMKPDAVKAMLKSLEKAYPGISNDIISKEDLAKYEWLATEKNTIVITDGHILSSTDVGTKKPFNVQILDNIKFNKQKQDEYIKIIENTDDFRNLTYALSTFPNIIIFPAGSKDSFYKNPFTIEYANATDDPVLQANTNIVDIQYNTKVKLRERVKSRAGQMNYVTYIVREDAELEIVRNSKDIGGWTLFDSRFVCHPGSKVTVKFKNEGSQYSQENFYFKCSSNVEVDLIGRNNIKKGNEYHQFVQLLFIGDHHSLLTPALLPAREARPMGFDPALPVQLVCPALECVQ